MRKPLSLCYIFVFLFTNGIVSSLLCLSASAQITPDANGIVYVKPAATGNGSGTTWANATGDLHGAIAAVGAQQVWVSVGTYNVTSSSFVMKNNLAIYGGFDPTNGIDDLTDARIFPNADNSRGSILNGRNERPVLWNYASPGSPINSTAVLDGFSLTGGAGSSGGGIFNLYASPTLTNLLIKGNSATNGGGIFNQVSSPVLTNVAIVNNTVTGDGGGVYNLSGNPVFTNVTIVNNTSSAMYVAGGDPLFNNSIVYGGISGTYFFQYSLIEGNTSLANNNINATGILIPHLFVSPSNGNYSLVPNSPVADKGSNALYSGLGASTQDLGGRPRLTGAKVDLGAYEFFGAMADANGIVYVKTTAMGSGKSWADATGSLHAAIDAAGAQQVWVEKGTYEVSANSFTMKNNVAIYGGFDPVNGIDDLSDARILASLGGTAEGSVLNGRNERPVIWNYADLNNPLTATAILDGFTLTAGFGGEINGNGGAIHNYYASPTLNNLVIKNNAAMAGGGIYNNYSSPVVKNCRFFGNTASSSGGAVYNTWSTPKFINCLMYGNTGGIYGGGAMYNNLNSSPSLMNCTIVANHAANVGGAIYSMAYSSPSFTNSIVYGNTAGNGEPGINYAQNFTYTWPAIYNSLIQGVTTFDAEENATFTGQNVYYAGSMADLFNNPDQRDYTLKPGCPTIDRGYSYLITNAGITKDLAGRPRIQGARVDMGVFEADACAITSTLYVNAAMISTGNGSSWENAYQTLKEAIDMAQQCPNVTEIRVAAGTYYPTGNGAILYQRNAAFTITRSNLKIAGGYNATTGARNVAANPTLLRGVDAEEESLNYHVMVLAGIPTTDSLIIDGFTLANGYATGTDFPIVNGEYIYQDSGAGMFIINAGANTVIRNCTIRNNFSAYSGGGVYNESSSASFQNCTFKDNTSIDGGGMYNSASTVTITNGTFNKNTATAGIGGGIVNDGSSAAISNSVFSDNKSFTRGGAIANSYSSLQLTDCIIKSNTTTGDGGGIYATNSSSLVLKSVALTNNTATNRAGGIHFVSGAPVLTNVTMANNTAGTAASGAVYIESGTPQFNNSIIYGGLAGTTYTARYCLIEGKSDTGNGNINATGITITQVFTSPSTADYTLLNTSPAVDGGSDLLFSSLDANTKDLAGNPRLYGPAIDMGPYELFYVMPNVFGIVYVKTVATGARNGHSWADATASIQGAIDAAGVRQVWVASGTYEAPASGFVMKNNVAIYGGFDPDHGIDDLTDTRILPDPDNSQGSVMDGKNLYLIIRNSFTESTTLNSTALLDGFTLTNGKGGTGGAIYNGYASPTLTNLVVKNNNADLGGGVANDRSSPKMSNIVIKNNLAYSGGGLCNINSSSAVLTNVKISDNRAATGDGGGGVYNISSNSVYVNVSITGNSSNQGGGFYNSGGSPVFTNVTLANNAAGAYASTAIFNGGGEYKIHNSIIYGTIRFFSYADNHFKSSLIEDVSATGPNNTNAIGNINAAGITLNHIFTNPGANDYTLLPCSPAINSGDNLLIPSYVTTDITGADRVQLGVVDLGAYEAASNIPGGNATLATNYQSATRTLNHDEATFFANDCATLIVKINSIGENPITGETTARAWIEATPPTNFVKRHFEIFPVNSDPDQLTGEITLYFTQKDFDDYNLVNTIKLPTGPDDTEGIANLIIEKRGGVSSDGSGLPLTYPGDPENILPWSIEWNATMKRWEMQILVMGFSGFFVKTNSTPLPVKLVSFEGKLIENRSVQLSWNVTEQAQIASYVVEYSATARDFQEIGSVTATSEQQTSYQYNDLRSPTNNIAYYRLKILENDGSFAYSRIISVALPHNEKFYVYPVPADKTLWLTGMGLEGTEATIITTHGQVVHRFTMLTNPQQIDISSLPAGVYFIRTYNGMVSKIIKK